MKNPAHPSRIRSARKSTPAPNCAIFRNERPRWIGLRRPTAGPGADATLHQSIMRAVRTSAAESAASGAGCSPLPIGRAPMTIGFAALAAIGIWLAVRPPAPVLPTTTSNAQSLAAAQIVLDVTGEISRSVPDAVVAPLSNELAFVDHDIRDTTQFVLGVLP